MGRRFAQIYADKTKQRYLKFETGNLFFSIASLMVPYSVSSFQFQIRYLSTRGIKSSAINGLKTKSLPPICITLSLVSLS